MGARPPNFNGFTLGGGMCPPHFYWIHNALESLFEKNKNIGEFRKISSKFVQNFQKSLTFHISFAKLS